MRGLRTQESTKFTRFFEVIQEEAGKRGCVFFMDCGEGNDFEKRDIEGEDLSGWLLPNEESARFEKEWSAFEEEAKGEWDQFYTFAEWSENNGSIAIEFNKHA